MSKAVEGGQKISTFGSRATSTVSVCLVLLLVGVSGLLGLAAHHIEKEMRSELGFTISVSRGSDTGEIADLRVQLAEEPGVASVNYVSAESILASERAALGIEPVLEAGENPYNAEIEVRMTPTYATGDSIRALAARYADSRVVDEIYDHAALAGAVDSTLIKIRTLLVIVAAILLVISIALINNAVSLSIYSRRFSIHTMRLVGATAGFIRRPFVRAGAVNGLVAGVLAGGIICGLRFYAANVEPSLEIYLPWVWTFILSGVLVLGGLIICSATSYFATNRYLAKSYDELFLK